MLLFVPDHIAGSLGPIGVTLAGLIKSVVLFVVLPAILWLLPYAAVRLEGAMRFTDYLRTQSIAFIPIMAGAHAAKSVLKMTSRIPYWNNGIADPVGIDTARGFMNKTIPEQPLPGWTEPLLTVVSLALVGAGVALSIVIVRRLMARALLDRPASAPATFALYLIPGLYGGMFLVMLLAWRVF